VYLGDLDFFGLDTLTFTTNDLGNTGTGGPLTDTKTVGITILSAQQQAGLLAQQVANLVASGVLTSGQGGALAQQLELQGNAGDAARVRAFLFQVEAFRIAGILSDALADSLAQAAAVLLASITNSDR
jgi:hypothetical protein